MKIENSQISDELGIDLPIRFKTKTEIEDPKYALYAWIDDHAGAEWSIKVGSAKMNGVAKRLRQEQGVDVFNRVVGLWEPGAVGGNDGPVHKALKQAAKVSPDFRHANGGKRGGTMSEVYMFKSLAALRKILETIDKVVGAKNATKVAKPLFPDIKKLVSEISADSSEKHLLDLPPRWGKTRTALELAKADAEKRGVQVTVMMSYVGTAKKSYADEIATNLAYDGLELVDPDLFKSEKECKQEIEKLLEAGKQVFYYFALTGDKQCAKRRLTPLLELGCKMDMFVDEADFGAKCDEQINKIQKAWKKCEFVRFYGMTGTNAECIKRMWPDEKLAVWKRDYIVDVLKAGNREAAVRIAWHVLDNASLAEAVGSQAAMENFSGMCEIVDGHLKEEAYFKQLLRWLYLNDAAFDPRKFREQAKAQLVDPDYATMVFLPSNKACHFAFAQLVESCIPGAKAYVVNGDNGVTNASAEDEVKHVIEENARIKGIPDGDSRRGRSVFIIAAGMANRSFSVKEIKNVLLLVNGGEYWSIAQKIARGLTPYAYDPRHPFTGKDPRKTCNVIDFRLAWQFPQLSAWLSGLGIEVMRQESHMTETDAFQVIHEVTEMASKVTFDEYRWNGLEPVRKLGEEELLVMMQTRDFQKERMVQLADLDELPEPKRCELDEAIDIAMRTMSTSNVKGDSSKRVHRVKVGSRSREEDGEEEVQSEADWKLQHLNFVWNHADWLSTPGCKTLGLALGHMSAKRKAEYEKQFGIDMSFICKLVKHLKDKHFEIELSEIS